MAGFFSKLFSMGEGKQQKLYDAKVDEINALEDDIKKLSDEELRAKTDEFRSRINDGETLDEILPEAFAVVREASVRSTGMRHFDVQLIGGIALHEGKIAEMKTGEGKTLVSTLAGYLNALSGNCVHIITVNDYLAKRDSIAMGRIYKFLGMKVGLLQSGEKGPQKEKAYSSDVVYGTNSEFGFDYLRDNMMTSAVARVQNGHTFAIVDEVDSILIDEARTPLIISGPGMRALDEYKRFAAVMPALKAKEDYVMDEVKKTIHATEDGLIRIEKMLGIEDLFANPELQYANHLQQALRAQFMMKKDVDYVVMDGELKIVDSFTGRIMEGRRFSEGLHQALEAKEGVKVEDENQTLATITLQNYFRLYEKLSGMTGTAMTEEAEFRQIYNLPVASIPPNKTVIRKDENDLIYKNVEAKFRAVANEVAQRNANGQPCLIGTVSIEKSEQLSRALSKRGIKHEVLNAKNHEREATIISQAGRFGAVTIATNMAGRGTDILLGGNAEIMAEDFARLAATEFDVETGEPVITTDMIKAAQHQASEITSVERDQVVAAGGLAVIGTERHESRRIDNQLRGRSGRQGDPGITQFYLSLEDDLMRLFGGTKMDSISNMMEKTGMSEDDPIQAGMVSKVIESAQKQVESMHFAARKNVLEYDDVMNLQRSAIYKERNAILDGKSVSDRIPELIGDNVSEAVDEWCPAKIASDDWDIEALGLWFSELTGVEDTSCLGEDLESSDDDSELLKEKLQERTLAIHAEKSDQIGKEALDKLEMQVMLRIIDTRWIGHLLEMDYLKSGIGLRSFGQRDPLVEYKNEAYESFAEMTSGIYSDFLKTILRLKIAAQASAPVVENKAPELSNVSYSSPEATLDNPSGISQAARKVAASAGIRPENLGKTKTAPIVKDKEDPFANVGRNDACPCGSGKKFKKCHGANL